MTVNPTIELYVGTAIEHASEREVLAALIEHLSSSGEWGAIFANFHIGGRQLDFLVATDKLTLVVEAKTFSRRIRGKVNGLWQMEVSGGDWKNVGNPYLQVLDAAHALKDHLRSSYGETMGYPAACVVVVPSLPAGSDVPVSDFKVSIIGTDHLPAVARKTSGLRLSRGKWATFAHDLRLQLVQSIGAACDPKLLEQEAILAAYRSEFLRTYAPDISSLKHDSYGVGDEEFDASSVADLIAHEDLMVLGPSGCGKTLLAKFIAIHSLGQGYVPIFLQAKYFSGKLKESIEREASVLGALSATSLIRAAGAVGRPLLLVLDGYNECPAVEQLALTRSLAAAVRRFGVRLVVSAQANLARADLIGARQVAVKYPSESLKAAIAGTSAGGRNGHLLESVSSGLEAELVGRVGGELDDGSSHFALFDAYARQKLGDDAFDGIRLLAAVAGRLIDRMSFSLSIRDFDRLAGNERIPGVILGRIVAAGLLVTRSDKVSFPHELTFAAFAAESVVRRYGHNIDGVLQALSAPKYRNARYLILGAYDDDEFVVKVLAGTVDADLLQAASEGVCGAAARHWALSQCAHVLEKLTQEAATVEFSLHSGTWNGAGICEDSTSGWTPTEVGILSTISRSVRRGFYLDEVLHAVGVMDQSLSRGFKALRVEASGKRIALRSGLFADAYVMSSKVGLSQLLRHQSNAKGLFDARKSEFMDRIKIMWEQARTPGQTYLLLSLARFADGREFILPYILPLLCEKWKYQPYHLQLALLDFAHFVRPADESMRQQLVGALNELLSSVGPILSGIVFESLEQLGALEDDVSRHVDTVKMELQHLLSDPMDESKCTAAWGAYVCQFDHPYSAAYCEALQELTPDNKKRVLAMACRGAGSAGMFVAPLIQELVRHDDSSVAPTIERWLELPAADSFMPQDAVSVFLWAHVALGMLGVPLPARKVDKESPVGAAYIAFGDLHYWIHRQDLTGSDRKQACGPALAELAKFDQFGAASALHMVTMSMSHDDRARESVIEHFPDALVCICRNALRQPDQQASYFPHFTHDRRGMALLSIDLIGHLGDIGDLPLLRSLSDDVEIGSSAIDAIRTIERRASGFGD